MNRERTEDLPHELASANTSTGAVASRRPALRARLPAASEGEGNLSLRDHLLVIRRRRSWILSFVVLGLSAAALFNHLSSPLYRATTTLIVEPDIPELSAVSADALDASAPRFYETQYEILGSNTILGMVAEKAHLADDPAFAGRDILEQLRNHISVQPVAGSRLVRLGVEHGDRDKAIAIANTLAQVYIQHSRRDRLSTSENTFEWLSGQLDELAETVEQSERALLEYRGTEDLVSHERRQELLEERLASLSEQYNEITAKTLELKTMQSELERLKQQPEMVESLPRLLESTHIRNLKDELSNLDVELAKVQKRYKAKHPKLLSLQSQIDVVRKRLGEEADKIHSSVGIEHRISQAKEQAILSSLNQAKAESSQLAEQAIRYGVLKRKSESTRKMYDVLLQRLQETDLSGSVQGQNIRVLDPATASARPYKPRKALNLLLAVSLALVIGVGVCFVVDQIDHTLKTEEEVTQHLGDISLLGLIPWRSKKPVSFASSLDREVEHAYQDVKTSVRMYARDHVLKTLLVCSTGRSEGKTATTFCLGSGLALSGLKTLLVDADLFKSTLTRQLGVANDRGLSSYFLDDADAASIVCRTAFDNLDIIPAGLIPPHPAEPLASPRMIELLETVKRSYDIVLIDSPPINVSREVAYLSSMVDGTLLVIRARATPRPEVKRTIDALRSARANVVGAVLTAADDLTDGRRYGYDEAYYSPEKASSDA